MLYDKSGVFLDDSSKLFLENRLQHSVYRLQFDNFRDYYELGEIPLRRPRNHLLTDDLNVFL